MRKLFVAAMAVAVLAVVVSVAFAANTYTVHMAGTSAKGKGSSARPIPTAIRIGFRVAETDPSKRATVIEKYSIGAEGIKANPKGAARCAFTDLDNQSGVPSRCRKALVGSGLVKNAAGPSNDQRLSESAACNLQLRLYNIGTGLAIRLDSNGEEPPPSFESDQIGCPLPIATAIKARFVQTRIAGVPATDLRFTVPQNLKHPVTGVDNSIRESENTIARKVREVAGRQVGFYNKVGCKGTRRTTRATFTTEATASAPPQRFTATKQSRC